MVRPRDTTGLTVTMWGATINQMHSQPLLFPQIRKPSLHRIAQRLTARSLETAQENDSLRAAKGIVGAPPRRPAGSREM